MSGSMISDFQLPSSREHSMLTKTTTSHWHVPCCTPGTIEATIQPDNMACTISWFSRPLSQSSNCPSAKPTRDDSLKWTRGGKDCGRD